MLEIYSNQERQKNGSSSAGGVEAQEAKQVDQLIGVFNTLFLDSHNTELVRGKDEPIYLPASAEYPHHRIIFAHGFFNSALHEIAHWCVAGKERRLLEDFGYWYEPDGRNLDQQKAFEKVEVKPQAYEWIFAACCDRKFRVSADNLGLQQAEIQHDDSAFKENIHKEVLRKLRNGLSPRSKRLTQALIEHFRPGYVLKEEYFKLQDLYL